MSRFRPWRPSPALVVSVIALVVALGGTAYAAFSLPKNSVGAKQLRKNAVTTKKIKNGAVTDSKIANNTITGDKIKAGTLTTAPTGAAGGALKGSYPNPGLASPEAVRVVGASGQPAFGPGWGNVGGSFQTAGFYKDAFGIVHLQGDVTLTSGTGNLIFTLPAGYCPTALENFAAYGNGGTAAGIAVRSSDCAVVLVAGDPAFIGLGGITFRAG